MNTSKKKQSIIYMVGLALLTAIVLLLQLAGITLRLPFLATPVSLVGIPIALGAMLLGPTAGAFLGFVFGAEVVIVLGIMGGDPFTATLFQDHPLLTTLLCIVKGAVAGWGAGMIYKHLKKIPDLLRVILASVAVPILNTGIFIAGSYTMMDTFKSNFLGDGTSMFYFLVIVCAGINFIFEFAVNIVFSPALHRIVTIVSKQFKLNPPAIKQSTTFQKYNMKWYKFIVYFALFFSAAVNLISAIMCFSGFSQTNMLYHEYPAFIAMDMIYGLLLIGISVFALVTRNDLYFMKKRGPKLLCVFYAINAVMNLLYIVIASIILKNTELLSKSIWLIISILGSALMIVLNWIYFNKRKDIFVE